MIFATVLLLMSALPVPSYAQDTHAVQHITGEGDMNAAELAKALADQVIKSETESDAYPAILTVLKAVNVGVYTTSGKPIHEGAERAPGDFYLYDFEAHALAQSVVKQDTRSLADVVAFLSHLGFVPDNAQLTIQTLSAGVQQGTKLALQNPSDLHMPQIG